MRGSAILALGTIAAGVLLSAAACSSISAGGGMMGRSGPPGSVTVELLDWSVTPSQSSVRAGTVTFHAVHPMMDMMRSSEGGYTHALTVARVNPDGSYEVLGSVWDIGLGQSKDLTLALSPGSYELQCNVVEELGRSTVSHYNKGMHTTFTVTS